MAARFDDWLYPPITPNRSSWVASYGFAALKDGRVGIAIQFLKGFVAFYPGTDENDFASLRNSKSKGKWIWRNIIANDYEELH